MGPTELLVLLGLVVGAAEVGRECSCGYTADMTVLVVAAAATIAALTSTIVTFILIHFLSQHLPDPREFAQLPPGARETNKALTCELKTGNSCGNATITNNVDLRNAYIRM